MKFNIKLILIGGVVYYVAQFLVSMIGGVFIHEGVLEEAYIANASFWRPELVQDPPDMATLMPRWIATGLIVSFIAVAVFDNIRSAFDGSGLVKGLKFGFIVFLMHASAMAAWSGIFNLPEMIWIWWAIDALIYFVVGGAALGWVTAKVAPE